MRTPSEDKGKIFKKICRFCALLWICSWPIAFGTVALTNGDFAKLGILLEQPHVVENYKLIKTILNIGLNLHIGTSIPAAFAFLTLNKKENSQIGEGF